MKISEINQNIKAMVMLDKDGVVKTYYKDFNNIESQNQGQPIIKIFNPDSNNLEKMFSLIGLNVNEDSDEELELSGKVLIELVKLLTDLELDENDDIIEAKFNSVELLRTVAREVSRIPISYFIETFNNIKDYGIIPEELRKLNNTVEEMKTNKKSNKKKSGK